MHPLDLPRKQEQALAASLCSSTTRARCNLICEGFLPSRSVSCNQQGRRSWVYVRSQILDSCTLRCKGSYWERTQHLVVFSKALKEFEGRITSNTREEGERVWEGPCWSLESSESSHRMDPTSRFCSRFRCSRSSRGSKQEWLDVTSC